MSEFYAPIRPRPREDPYASGIVQNNLEEFMQFFQKGLADGDILVWDQLLGRYLARPAGGVELLTTLPSSDVYPGREMILTNDPNNPSYLWHLRYNADSPSLYKWEFIGGSPALAVTSPWEGTFSSAYVNVATPGPELQLPVGVGGDFLVEVGCIARQATLGREARMSYDLGAISASDSDSCVSTLDDFISISNKRRKVAVQSGALIRAKYRTSNSSDEASFRERWITVQPYRVG